MWPFIIKLMTNISSPLTSHHLSKKMLAFSTQYPPRFHDLHFDLRSDRWRPTMIEQDRQRWSLISNNFNEGWKARRVIEIFFVLKRVIEIKTQVFFFSFLILGSEHSDGYLMGLVELMRGGKNEFSSLYWCLTTSGSFLICGT